VDKLNRSPDNFYPEYFPVPAHWTIS